MVGQARTKAGPCNLFVLPKVSQLLLWCQAPSPAHSALNSEALACKPVPHTLWAGPWVPREAFSGDVMGLQGGVGLGGGLVRRCQKVEHQRPREQISESRALGDRLAQ